MAQAEQSRQAVGSGGSNGHAGLVSRLRGQLADNPSSSSITATCPICGCPVTVGR